MTESKPKKTTTKASKTKPNKIADVTKPAAPSKSSRSIIVNNRPIMRDPMVAASDEVSIPDIEPGQGTKVEVKRLGKEIKPESSAETPSLAPSKDDAKKEEPKTVQPITPDFSEVDDKSKDDTPSEKLINLDEKPAPQNLADLLTDGKTDQTAKADKKEEEATTKEEATDQVSDSDKASPNEPAVDNAASQPDEAKTKEEKPKEKPTKNTEASESTLDTNEDKPAPTDMTKVEPGKTSVDDPTEDESETTGGEGGDKNQLKPPKGRQLTAEQAKAIESGKYFLPIQTADNRRARRDTIIFVILGIVLILIWLDVLLDANLISLGGIKPVTDFL